MFGSTNDGDEVLWNDLIKTIGEALYLVHDRGIEPILSG